MKKYVNKILDQIEESDYEIRFTSKSSGLENYMIHLYFDNRIYAIRFFENTFGISKVDKEVELFTIPDKNFQSWNDFQTKLGNLL